MADESIIYDAEGIQLIRGDSRVILPGLPSSGRDAPGFILCDPPYGLGIGYGRSELGHRYIEGDHDTGLLTWVFSEAFRLLAAPAWCCVFCGYSSVGDAQTAALAAGFKIKTVLVWDKCLPGLGSGIRNQYELIVLAAKGKPANSYQGGNIWRERRVSGRPLHPNEKPVGLLARLIGCYGGPVGSVVLDPFAGSGSTLIAARRTGRRALGIEIDETYAEVARRRLISEDSPGALVEADALAAGRPGRCDLDLPS
jgi:site-specific DNA-methyltransferase (adenine-specific)